MNFKESVEVGNIFRDLGCNSDISKLILSYCDIDRGISINYNKMVEYKVQSCSKRCEKMYNISKKGINEVLEEYKEFLPVVFTRNIKGLKHIYAEIVNDKRFVPSPCLECCSWIVQMYGITADNIVQRITRVHNKESMCYN